MGTAAATIDSAQMIDGSFTRGQAYITRNVVPTCATAQILDFGIEPLRWPSRFVFTNSGLMLTVHFIRKENTMPVTQTESCFPAPPALDRDLLGPDRSCVSSISTRFNRIPNERAPHRWKKTTTQARMFSKRLIPLVASLVIFAGNVGAQQINALQQQSAHASSQEVNDSNAANNPLESLLTIDVQDRFMPSPAGFPGRNAGQALFRVAVPIDTFGLHNFVRAILPLDTTASVQGGPNTGVGNLEVYDILPFQRGGITFGAGPLIAAPTARGEAYDYGRWQAGTAVGVIDPHSWGLLAALVTYQHSFSGAGSGPTGGITTAEPFFFYHFSHGVYFRSSGVWTFDTFQHSHYIPLGFGFGKIWTRADGDLINLFIEPQYSVFQSGIGTPTWQIFAGVTFKFPIGKSKKRTGL